MIVDRNTTISLSFNLRRRLWGGGVQQGELNSEEVIQRVIPALTRHPGLLIFDAGAFAGP